MSDLFGDAIMQFIPEMRPPMRSDLVHSDESILGFETANSAGGLFIDLLTFQSVGLAHLEAYCEKFGGARIFLRKKIPADFEGEYESREHWSIVVMPQKIEVDLEEIDRNIECIPSLMSMTIDAVISATPALTRLENRFLSARESKKQELNLAQYESPLPVKVQPGNIKEKDWYCQVCGLKNENLWLNVIDGTILCGRKYREGTIFYENDEFKPSEGHGHAWENFKETNHPLVVKISSISPFGLVIYNYAQDEFVDDPQMASILAKIGVKTLDCASHELPIWENAEAPRENVRVAENGVLVKPLAPDHERIGISNTKTSNSAINSAVQLLARCPALRIYSSISNQVYLQSEAPVEDFNLQFAKIVSSLMDDDPRNWVEF